MPDFAVVPAEAGTRIFPVARTGPGDCLTGTAGCGGEHDVPGSPRVRLVFAAVAAKAGTRLFVPGAGPWPERWNAGTRSKRHAAFALHRRATLHGCHDVPEVMDDALLPADHERIGHPFMFFVCVTI